MRLSDGIYAQLRTDPQSSQLSKLNQDINAYNPFFPYSLPSFVSTSDVIVLIGRSIRYRALRRMFPSHRRSGHLYRP